MTKKDIRIVFLGNPEFARFHLEKIVDAGYNVVAVISAPDKPAGRGMQLRSTPVTQFARENSIDCLQPKNLKNADFLAKLASYKADVQVVIAFRMLPVAVWDMPALGTYNLHASLLPQYRGAAPINWAIINGETETGVTTFKLKHEIDTGNLVVQKKCEIEPSETAGSLHDKLMVLGADAIVETLDLLISDKYEEQPQSSASDLKTAPKIFTETCEINWEWSGQKIQNFIRGLNPYPTAHTYIDDKKLNVYSVSFQRGKSTIGELISDNKNYLGVGCKDGHILFEDIKLQGKKRMDVKDFLNGYKIQSSVRSLM